jgi:hypothetical protein
MKASQLRKLTAAARAARRAELSFERALDKPRAVPAPAGRVSGSRTVTSGGSGSSTERPR